MAEAGALDRLLAAPGERHARTSSVIGRFLMIIRRIMGGPRQITKGLLSTPERNPRSAIGF